MSVSYLFGDFLSDFLTIWVIIDPLTTLPVFIALSAGYDLATRRRMALITVTTAAAVLVFFISVGQIIINAMGISLRTFEVSGGIILFLFAVDLVIGKDKGVGAEGTVSTSPLERAIYPLAIPNLAGPGAMLTVMLRTDNSRISILEQMHTVAAVILVLAITFGLLLMAGAITRLIGIGGASVIKRIMGMIIAAYAAHLVFGGIADWLHMAPL